MPVNAVFGNSIFDIRCSKCKKLYEPRMFTTTGKIYKTCNCCRMRASIRRQVAWEHYHNQMLPNADDNDDVDSATAAMALLSLSSYAAASTFSADYFVDEPDPEPEP